MRSKSLQYYWLLIPVLLAISSSFQQNKIVEKNKYATVRINFINTLSENKIVLNDSTYTNPFGEKYTISRLQYYISNVLIDNIHKNSVEVNGYHLIDESKPESQVFNVSIPGATYDAINFLIGVDSLHNVSGAQTGDLDPTKGMFWTWNSGYVMAKMEGNSPASKLVNNKFEYHIGGFSGPNNVLKEIHLDFPGKSFQFDEGKSYAIIIYADINTWWQATHNIKIAEHANITSPGEIARDISENYANMFHIEKIISE
jgi:MbnP